MIADIEFIDDSILKSVVSLKSKLLFQGPFLNKRQDNSTSSGRSVSFALPAPNPKTEKKKKKMKLSKDFASLR